MLPMRLHRYGLNLARFDTNIVNTSKNQYNTDMSYPIHFRKKNISQSLKKVGSIRAVAQHFEINKNTIVEWKKRIEIKRTRPRKPSKVDDDALRADVEQYPMIINMNALLVLVVLLLQLEMRSSV